MSVPVQIPQSELESLTGQQTDQFRYTGASSSPAPPAPASPPDHTGRPTPKRPKGRLFVGAALVAVFAWGGHQLWSAFGRYDAYGIVSGRVVTVSAPKSGQIQYLAADEGSDVAQGELLVRLDDLTLGHDIERIADELRVAEANLSAEVARLRFEENASGIDRHAAVADYYKAWSEYQFEKAQLDLSTLRLARSKKLLEQRAVSQSEYEEEYYRVRGQSARLEQLKSGLDAWKQRREIAERLVSTGGERIRPFLTAIETLQSELIRLREESRHAELHASTHGRVLQRRVLPGEYVRQGDAILDLLESGTRTIVLYVPQRLTERFDVGAELLIDAEGVPEPIVCRVTKLGSQFSPAPDSIKRHYVLHEHLLEVHVRPSRPSRRFDALRVGATVRLPKTWRL